MDLIIARYLEELDWLDGLKTNKAIDNIYVYNKFFQEPIYIPNIGRESNTYLHHIINNYNNLNNVNVFLQGNPSAHSSKIQQFIRNKDSEFIKDVQPLGDVTIENEFSPSRKYHCHPHGLFLAYFFDLFFGMKLDQHQTVSVSFGAQFACTKKAILNRPIEFYQFMLKFVSHDQSPIEGYIFERLWLYIFDTRIPLSDKYKLWI